jgi:single-strand DNA-binding protein
LRIYYYYLIINKNQINFLNFRRNVFMAMLNGNNLCIFEGRLIADPKISQVTWNGKQGQQNATKAEFTLAVDKKMTAAQKQAAQQQGKPTADFPKFVVLGAQGDFVQKWLGKGKPCRVVGSFETNTWTDKQGQKQYGWVFQVHDIGFTLSDGNHAGGGNGQTGGGAANGGSGAANGGDFNNFQPVDDGDMPF